MPGIVLGTGDPAADTEHTETDNNPDLTLLGGGGAGSGTIESSGVFKILES